MNKKVLLIIMDGWGEGDKSKADLIHNTPTPFIQSLYGKAAYSRLKCAGEDVGLPEGQMGNSEVGHLNMGAGRVVYQDFVKINTAVKDNSIADNKTLKEAYTYARNQGKKVHFFGLVSEGGVHSSTKHLMKLLDVAHDYELKDVYVHAFTDGRDTDPQSGYGFVEDLQKHIRKSTGQIASVCGRYYAMDRDKRWERIKSAYDMLVDGVGYKASCPLQAIKESYQNGITDEFIKPTVICGNDGKPISTIEPDDVIICFNFRTDRLREITTVLTQKDFPDFEMKTIPLYYVTMTRYDESFKNIKVIFDKEDIAMTLGEVLSKNGKTQMRIAETEKYPHVTFFFSGGREEPFSNEKRVLIPSPKVATYDLKPEMSAVEVKEKLITEINEDPVDFICLNFANADMVGHTGVKEAIEKAVITVDSCVKEVTEHALQNGYTVIITADHGNADFAINEDGSPNTAHSTNPVPCFLIDKDYKEIKNGKLADLAPTILSLMSIESPEVMSGDNLLKINKN